MGKMKRRWQRETRHDGKHCTQCRKAADYAKTTAKVNRSTTGFHQLEHDGVIHSATVYLN